MFLRRIFRFVQNDIRVSDKGTVRLELFHIFLSGTPHRTQPVEVDIRILEDKEVGDRVTVISQCRRVVELAVRITRLEINAQCPRNLLLGGNHGGDTLETCIGENPFVLSVGDGRPYAAPVGFSGQGYRVGQGVSVWNKSLRLFLYATQGVATEARPCVTGSYW